MKGLAAALILLACTGAALAHVRCSGEGCGDEFIAQGWVLIAQCPGHNWSYLLRKDAKVLVCGGINGRAGPIEFPCRLLTEDVATLSSGAIGRCGQG